MDDLNFELKAGKQQSMQIVALLKSVASIYSAFSRNLIKSVQDTRSVLDGPLNDILTALSTQLTESAHAHSQMSNQLVTQASQLDQTLRIHSTARKKAMRSVNKLQSHRDSLSNQVQKLTISLSSRTTNLSIASSNLPLQSYQKSLALRDKTALALENAAHDYTLCHASHREQVGLCRNLCGQIESEREELSRAVLWRFQSAMACCVAVESDACMGMRLALETGSRAVSEVNMERSNAIDPIVMQQNVQFHSKVSDDKAIESITPPTEDLQFKMKTAISKFNSLAVQALTPSTATSTPMTLSTDQTTQPHEARVYLPPTETVSSPVNLLTHQPPANQSMSSPTQQQPTPEYQYDPFDVPSTLQVLFQVTVKHAYNAETYEELSIQKGQLLPVTFTHDDGWWEGVVIENGKRRRGLFPSNFVRVV